MGAEAWIEWYEKAAFKNNPIAQCKLGEIWLPIDIERFSGLQGVLDAIYNPLSTCLVLKAKKRDIPASGGLYMLVSQAVFAVEKFLGKDIPESEIDRVYEEIYLSKKNLVLIGMPGCGKSTIKTSLPDTIVMI